MLGLKRGQAEPRFSGYRLPTEVADEAERQSMGARLPLVLARASLITLAWGLSARAQQAAATAAAPPAGVSVSEIVVTARRRSERLQDVPQSVNAVTAETLGKLKLQQFQDIQTVVPGLTLKQGSSGFQAEASLRGVTFDVNTAAQPTVAMYLNDAPVQPNFLFQSLFDVGQIEVLRGPQGTARGISAPSGAITLTTHKADLKGFGGYAETTLTDRQGRNAQGAINVPIVKDVLALRVAGLIDQGDGDGVASLHDNIRPRQVTSALRTTLGFQPNDRVSGSLVYQHLDRNLTSFPQVIGPGDGTAVNPPLAPKDRASVVDGANLVHQHTDVVTAQVDADFSGRRVSYVGSYQNFRVATAMPQDVGNVLPGIELVQTDRARQQITTQELRLASIPAPGRFLDYMLGGFYQRQDNSGLITQVGTFLPGAFGPPAALGSPQPVDLAAYDPRYQVPILISVPSRATEASIFGTLTLHIGDRTELTGGARHIFSRIDSSSSLNRGVGLIALPCAAPPPGSTYPGACDFATPAAPIQSLSNSTTERPNIYNVSISRRLKPGVLLYANTGTSWRPGPTAIGVLNATNDPVLNSLTFLKPERSRSFEIGLKSTLLGGRARLNVAVWRQNYHDLIMFVPNVPYLANSGTGFSVNTFSFTANADAVVGGIDIDSAFQVTPDWTVAVQYSYAGGHVVNGAKLPCNDSNFDGVPDQGAVTSPDQFPPGTLIALCPGGPVSRNPLWNISLQTEYAHPVADTVDGFFRGLVAYYPKNDRAEPAFTVSNYSLVNLYAGLRSHDGAWELALFARNAFGTNELLDRGTQFETAGALGTFFPEQNVGHYVTAAMTAQREVGVSAHYAWGSR
jgi:iron complex outermembrane receptor protein